MNDDFDPYLTWLGISPEDRPPTHYRLLGIPAFASDADVISRAAAQRVEHIRTVQSTADPAISQHLLDQIWLAKACLLDHLKKAAYDVELNNRMAAGFGNGALVKKLPPAVPMFQATNSRLSSPVPVSVPASVPVSIPIPIAVAASPQPVDAAADGLGAISVRAKRVPRKHKSKSKSWQLGAIGFLTCLLIALVIGGIFLWRRDPAASNLTQQGITAGDRNQTAGTPAAAAAPAKVVVTPQIKSSAPPASAGGSAYNSASGTNGFDHGAIAESNLLPLSADSQSGVSLPYPKSETRTIPRPDEPRATQPPASGRPSDAAENAGIKDQDALGAKVRAFKASAGQAQAPSELKSVSEQGIRLVRQAIAEKQKELAQECADVSLVAARRCDCPEQLRQITLLVLEVQQMSSQ